MKDYDKWEAVYIERCTYGFGARLWKPTLETRQGAVVLAYNLQRERISPSEKAFAYKMKYEVIKRKTGRRKCGQVDHHSGKKSIEVISEECGDSPKQVQRYIKITDLIPELLEKVDDGSMGFTPAVQISYLKKKEQEEMLEAMEFAQCTPSLSQAIRLKKLSSEGKLSATVCLVFDIWRCGHNLAIKNLNCILHLFTLKFINRRDRHNKIWRKRFGIVILGAVIIQKIKQWF